MREPCAHDWIVIVPNPLDRPHHGVQQCTRCLVEVDRIHPPPPVFIEPDAEPLAAWQLEQLLELPPFGPVAAGLVRPRHLDVALAPTFLEPS